MHTPHPRRPRHAHPEARLGQPPAGLDALKHPLHPHKLDPFPPHPRNLLLQLPARQPAAGASRGAVGLAEDDVRDGAAGEGDGDVGAVLGEEVFEFEVAHRGGGGAVDVDAQAAEQRSVSEPRRILPNVGTGKDRFLLPRLLPLPLPSTSSAHHRRHIPPPRVLPQGHRRPPLPPAIRFPPVRPKPVTARPHGVGKPLPPARPASELLPQLPGARLPPQSAAGEPAVCALVARGARIPGVEWCAHGGRSGGDGWVVGGSHGGAGRAGGRRAWSVAVRRGGVKAGDGGVYLVFDGGLGWWMV